MDVFDDILRGIPGVIVMIAIAWLLSTNRRAVNWRMVIIGLGLQFILALLILKVPFIYTAFNYVAQFFVKVLDFTEAGASFIFGSWPGGDKVAALAVLDENGEISSWHVVGLVFAFKILPTIVFFSALSALLYYLGILQIIIKGFAWIMGKAMGLSGAESVAAAANVFIGQTEAPLIVKPYLESMTRSEIMCLMTGGMATIAGSVFAAFVGFLGGGDPELEQLFATHLLTASIISAPAAIVAAKIMYPETKEVNTAVRIPKEKIGSNLLDAITLGTSDGVRLAVNVGAMLLVFIAMIAMVNYICMDMIGEWTGWNEQIRTSTDGKFKGFNLEYIFGLVFAPLAWLLGVPNNDIFIVGQMLGTKTVINEFVAYVDLAKYKNDPTINLQPKSVIIATYALCGFANFSSIGIQIGGISAIAPSQRKTLTELGLRALVGGTIACFMTAIIAGMLVQNY